MFIVFFLSFGSIGESANSKPSLLVDYLLISQLGGGSNADTQIARDNLSEVTEGRKIAFFTFAALLLYAFFPAITVQEQVDRLFDQKIWEGLMGK